VWRTTDVVTAFTPRPGRRGEEEMETIGVENIPKAKKTEKKAQMRYEDKRKIGRTLNVYRKLVEKFGLAPGDWAAIDFHPKKHAVVFVPPNVLRAVEQEELPRFLMETGVKKALVDSLVPKYSDVLVELDKSGFEVYYLSWPEVLDDFKAFVKRIMKEQKKRFQIEIRKDDYTDAVLLSFISPYHSSHRSTIANSIDAGRR
jgi:hypothetical protein